MIAGTRPAPRRVSTALTACLAVTALSLGHPWSTPVAHAAPADDPVGNVILDYDFEEAAVAGATVTDSSGRGRDGVLANPGSAQLVDGPSGGKALHLAGGAAAIAGGLALIARRRERLTD